MRARTLVALFSIVVAVSLAGGLTAAPTPAQRCLASKLKEMGKYDSCRLKAEAKAVQRGEAPDYSRCDTKLTQKWSTIEARGGCDQTGDQSPAQAESASHADEIVAILTGASGATCGDASVDVGEDCDGSDLAGESCVTQGFDSGTLACDGTCQFDTSACVASVCGDGLLDVGEQCDGTDVNGLLCFHLGFAFGGMLACDGSCTFDTSACLPLTCGNGTKEVGENCDGSDLGGLDCTSYGGTGTLACDSECDFDFSGCAFTCGDATINPGEDCDGTELGGAMCSFIGFTGGTLACTGGCAYDTSGCTATCGDGVISEGANEECDGLNLGGVDDCGDLGYSSGPVTCAGGCLFDVSSCVLECDALAQDCGGGEACYLGVDSTGGCQAPGGAGPLEACNVQSDCEARSACVALGTLGMCLPLCDSSIGDTDCPSGSGFTCTATNLPAAPNLGVCTPF